MLTRIRRLSDDRTIGSYNETSDAWNMEVVNEEGCWSDESTSARGTTAPRKS